MKSSPPPAFGSGLLARALAYHEQEKALGGLSAADRKQIKGAASRSGDGKRPPISDAPPGTWLARTWHGEVHQVFVLDDGVEYRGELYASLSAVARTITGARWSGPRFFGLKSSRLRQIEVTNSG